MFIYQPHHHEEPVFAEVLYQPHHHQPKAIILSMEELAQFCQAGVFHSQPHQTTILWVQADNCKFHVRKPHHPHHQKAHHHPHHQTIKYSIFKFLFAVIELLPTDLKVLTT